MRNTPFPGRSIGHSQHAFFRPGAARGLVQGIVSFPGARVIDAADLVDFDFLPAGQVREFDDGGYFEIAEFGGYHTRSGFISTLAAQPIELEPGGKLTGPMGWRLPSAPLVLEKSDSRSKRIAISIVLVFIVLAIAFMAFVMLELALVIVGAIAVLAVGAYGGHRYSTWRSNSIARMGSIWVYSPSSRVWGDRQTAEMGTQAA